MMFGISTVFAVGALMIGLWLQREEDLDDQLCPSESGPSREVIVLLDTSDPLTKKHQAEFRRILREMVSPALSGRHGGLAVRKGERVTLYVLNSSSEPVQPIDQICNPGNDSGSLTRGGMIIEWRYNQFVKVIEDQFPEGESDEQPESPILETMTEITARHAPSRRASDDTKPAHLIVISDLLQHTEILSHYESYPDPNSLPRELVTDLSRVEVSLFRLERHKYSIYQTQKHYYWWSDLVESMDGKIAWQQSL